MTNIIKSLGSGAKRTLSILSIALVLAMCFTTTSNAAGTLKFKTTLCSTSMPFFKTELIDSSSYTIGTNMEYIAFLDIPGNLDKAKYVFNINSGKWVDPTEATPTTPITTIPTDYLDCKYIVYIHALEIAEVDGTETVTLDSETLEAFPATIEEAYAKGGVLYTASSGFLELDSFLSMEKFKDMVAAISGVPVDTDSPAVASPATGDASDFILYGFTLLGSIVLASAVIKRKELN